MKLHFFTIIAILSICSMAGIVAAETLAESSHPYANDYDYTWTITDPSATQMRIHFQKLDLVNLLGHPISDTVKLYDGDDTLLATYSSDGEDFWSEWYMTDTIKVRLTTGSSYNAWGFLVDEMDVRTGMTCPPTDPDALAESCHDYANNYDYTWTITDPSATQMRIHFQKLDLVNLLGHPISDTVKLYDGDDTLLATYSSDGEDFWSEWYMTDTIKVRLTTGSSGTAWGFLVDQKDPPDPVAPDSVTGLHNTTYQETMITWVWTDPADTEFDHVMVYLDGVFQTNITEGIQAFTTSLLTPSTSYEIGTRTVGTTGLVNSTWVNHTAMTAPLVPVPPASLTNLHNTTYQQNSISWTWTDSTSADFDRVMVYINGVFQGNVTKGVQTYTASSLTPSTSYEIGTRTVGTTGLVNSTWVNHTVMTAPLVPIPPASLTNLHNITYLQDSVTWVWTDPATIDFDKVIIYINGVFRSNVTKGMETFTATGLTPETSYTIGTRTVGSNGLINSSWVNHTAMTAPLSGQAFSVVLEEGWSLFSTPVKLESGHDKFSDIFNSFEQQNMSVILGWDGSMWYIPQGISFEPLSAYYIKVKEGKTATAFILPSTEISAPPARSIIKGVNLIGPAQAFTNGGFLPVPLDEALISVQEVGSLTGYIIVISPSLNQPGWAYACGGQVSDLLPFKGYWVVMENGPDTLYGFSTTPIS